MTILLSWRFRAAICLFAVMLVSSTGCQNKTDAWKDNVPGNVKSTNSASENSVVELPNQIPAAPMPSVNEVLQLPLLEDIADLSIFDPLEDKIELTSLWEANGTPPEFKWPDDTDEPFRMCMKRFLDEPIVKTVFSFPVNKTKSRVSADMSADGKLLYVIDIDNFVHVIEVDSGNDKSFKSPLKNSYAILADVAGEHVFLANDKTLAKVNLGSQSAVGTIDGIFSGILDWDRALETNALVAVNASQFMYVDENFERFELMPDTKTRAAHVAIHPQGKYIASSSDGRLFRWYVSETPHRVETLAGDSFSFRYNPVTCDYDADRWFDTFGMHEYAGAEHSDSREIGGTEPPFVINPLVSDAISCSLGESSWSTLVGTMQDGTASPPVVMASMRWRTAGRTQHSYPIRIDAKEVTRLWGNRRGDRVAMYTDIDIRVCDRSMFDDPTGEIMALPLAKRVYFDQLGQIEVAANYLRSRNWPEKMLTGEQIYLDIAGRVADEWEWCEKNTNAPETAKAIEGLEKWKASGNEIALIASAIRHLSMGHEARGNALAKDVTKEGFAELDRRLALASEDIDKLLAKDKPPGAAFKLKILTMTYGGAGIDEGFLLVERCMELYPEFLGVHDAMTHWLLPRWGGTPGAVHTYLEKIASLYPEKLRDAVYAILAIDAVDASISEPLYGPYETNISLERTYRGGEVLMSQNKLRRFPCEVLVEIAYGKDDVAELQKFADYHITHFITPTSRGHETKTGEVLPHRKGKNMAKTRKLQSKAAK